MGENHYTALVGDGRMSMEQWWNDSERGNLSAGRKCIACVVAGWKSMEQLWNDTDRGN